MRRTLCATLIAAMALLPMQAARAEMIGVLQNASSSGSPVRTELVQKLQDLGVPREAAQARVAALSDEEAAKLAAQASAAPAGGNAFFLFVTLLAVFAIMVYQSLHPK